MDDATSSSSDSVSDTPVQSSTTTLAQGGRSFAPRPRRLARGLNDLFARGAGPVEFDAPAGKARPALVDDSSAGPVQDARAGSAAEDAPAANESTSDPASELAALAQATTAPVASNNSSSTAMQVDASPSPTGFEYRFVQLVSRLDATCNLFADARQTHLVAAQRNIKVAWSVAAALAIVAGIALWMAGSKATYNKAQLDYEQTRSAMIEKNLRELTEQNAVISAANEALGSQQQSLAGKYETVQEQAQATAAEIETIRRALSKANAVIDELMVRPEQPLP